MTERHKESRLFYFSILSHQAFGSIVRCHCSQALVFAWNKWKGNDKMANQQQKHTKNSVVVVCTLFWNFIVSPMQKVLVTPHWRELKWHGHTHSQWRQNIFLSAILKCSCLLLLSIRRGWIGGRPLPATVPFEFSVHDFPMLGMRLSLESMNKCIMHLYINQAVHTMISF